MRVVAVLCADVHLSLTPPISRSAEPDWLKAQARILEQANDLAIKHGCSVLCAGDLFDRWNPPVELVNFFLELEFDPWYAVPGQHDLPMHNRSELHRSAYHTTELGNGIVSLGVWPSCIMNDVQACGCPWGSELPREVSWNKGALRVAVVHAYNYQQGGGYPGAPEDAKATAWAKRLRGTFDVGVFGDNHKMFWRPWTGGGIYNCGCLIPRKQDERAQPSMVGLLHDNGRVVPYKLDNSGDRWLDVDPRVEQTTDNSGVRGLLEMLAKLDGQFADYKTALMQYVDRQMVADAVKEELLNALEGHKCS